MSILILLVAVLPAVALEGQGSLPPDINPVMLSRLPPVTRSDLDAAGQRLLDATGLAEKDATLIRFFRALFREHRSAVICGPGWSRASDVSVRSR